MFRVTVTKIDDSDFVLNVDGVGFAKFRRFRPGDWRTLGDQTAGGKSVMTAATVPTLEAAFERLKMSGDLEISFAWRSKSC